MSHTVVVVILLLLLLLLPPLSSFHLGNSRSLFVVDKNNKTSSLGRPRGRDHCDGWHLEPAGWRNGARISR